jgi:hypothetical protein
MSGASGPDGLRDDAKGCAVASWGLKRAMHQISFRGNWIGLEEISSF